MSSKKEIHESKHLLDSGKTVYINGEKHEVYEFENLIGGGKTVYVDDEKHVIHESKHLLDNGRTVYDNNEKHDIYEFDHLLDNGRTVYDNNERHDIYEFNHLLDGGKTVYDISRDENSYGKNSGNSRTGFEMSEADIRKYSRMAPAHTTIIPDFNPSWPAILLGTVWFIALGLLAMANMRNYMAGPVGCLFLGLCFLPMAVGVPFVSVRTFQAIFHMFLGAGILSLLPVMDSSLANADIFLGIIFLFALEILLSLFSSVGYLFWTFGIAIIGLYFWHGGYVKEGGWILAAYMVSYPIMGLVMTNVEKGMGARHAKPDGKLILRNLAAGFLPPLAGMLAVMIDQKIAPYVFMAAAVAVAILFAPKQKYSLYYSAFLLVGTSLLFGFGYLAMLPAIPSGPLGDIWPVWNQFFQNPVCAWLSRSVIEMIDGLWMMFDAPLTKLYHMFLDWGNADSYTALRLISTVFLYLFAAYTGIFVTGAKNRKKKNQKKTR